ncbi:GPI mannosyltransferase 4-like [Sarcoptes scabiei]|nr:GPI mannosyltransferase 4-like [Sarcoptes scabiei]
MISFVSNLFFSLLFSLSLIVSFFSSLEALRFGSFCNPINGCHQNNLVCHLDRCRCAPGHLFLAGHCLLRECHDDLDCYSSVDPFRTCHLGFCNKCLFGMQLDKQTNRCRSLLGQPCHLDSLSDDFALLQSNQSLVCRNGMFVCKPNHYPDPMWTHCQSSIQQCRTNQQCQMFSDYHRICRENEINEKFCVCDEKSHENLLTLQCIPSNSRISSFIMMPFFLLPTFLMIIIVAYVGNRVFRSNQTPSAPDLVHRSLPDQSSRRIDVTQSISQSEQSNRNNIENKLRPSTSMDFDRPPCYELAIGDKQNHSKFLEPKNIGDQN